MKTILFLIACFCFQLKATSQTAALLLITGKVTDSVSQKPVDYATVVLKDDKKVSLKTVLTNPNGSFAFHGLKPGNYLISVVSMGFKSRTIPVRLENENANLGILHISAASERLKEVMVTADKPLIRQEIDRLSYDLKADPESKVSNVLEMMRKVPLLSLDADDNIQLQGNSNYKILVNGKPSSMMERSPKDILRSMPASSIEKIEVITTPPAKYDGEGLAGIINIITTKNADNGFNGTVNINERFPVGGPGIGGSFTVKSGRFGASGIAGASRNSSPETISTSSRQTDGSAPSSLIQTGLREFSGKSGYVGTEVSFEIDSLNLISGQLNFNLNDIENISSQNSALNRSGSLVQAYDLLNNRTGSGDGMDAALNYQLGSKKDKNRLLTLSYRYYQFSNDQFNSIDVFNSISYNLPDYRQDNRQSFSETTLQVDYVYPIKKITIEAGVKGIFRNNSSNFQVESVDGNSGQFVTDPMRTNRFSNTQNVWGIYNTYQFNIGKWGVKGGLRVEQTIMEADFYSAASQIQQTSLNFIPSVSVHRKFKDMSSINFGFTSRIQRPGIHQLNPFIDRSDPDSESTGNPALQPMTGNSFEINYSKFKKATINVGARLILFNDLIMPQVVVDQETNVTRSSFANTGSARLLATSINVNYPLIKQLKVNLGVNFNYGKVKGEVNGVMLENQGLMSRAFSSLAYRFENGWQANGSVNYNGPNLTLQGSTNSFVASAFSVSKDFLKNKLSFSAAANNVFSKYRDAVRFTTGTYFNQESLNQSYLRNFTVSVNYRFGTLKEKIKKSKKGINNNDVSDDGSSL